jgi:hypothetical protein
VTDVGEHLGLELVESLRFLIKVMDLIVGLLKFSIRLFGFVMRAFESLFCPLDILNVGPSAVPVNYFAILIM